MSCYSSRVSGNMTCMDCPTFEGFALETSNVLLLHCIPTMCYLGKEVST